MCLLLTNKQEMNNRVKAIGFSEVATIAKNIRKLMEHNSTTESQLAKSLGVSVMTIRRVISGETEDPRISTVSLIADYFNVGLDSMLENRDMPINNMQKGKPYFVPIIDWEILQKKELEMLNFSNWKKWYPVINNDSLNLDQKSFAIESKASMQPRFPIGTLFIINPNEKAADNDIILIKSKDSGDLSLRELIIDSPKWILQPIVVGSELLYFNTEEHVIMGVIVLTILHSRN